MQKHVTGTSLRCPTCGSSCNQLVSYPNDEPSEDFVVWCPCGTIYVYDETAAPRGIPVYSFSEHEKL